MASTTHSNTGAIPYSASSLFPTTSEAAAKHCYLGKRLQDVQAPAVVIDVAVVRRNCELMLKTTADLGVDFRAHVKTHKTIQLSQLQVGEDCTDIRLIVSTVAEAESLLPWLLESKANGKKVNIIYGLPVAPSAIPRLAIIAQSLGEGSIALLVDHPDQIKLLDDTRWPHNKIPIFPKIDVGYHRAGVEVGTSQMADLAAAIKDCKRVQLMGFYAHMGHSYGVGSPGEALKYLTLELQRLEEGAHAVLKLTGDSVLPQGQQLTLSLGASPTTTASQNLVDGSDDSRACKEMLDKIRKSYNVELHAGVYPVMDMQQLATRARPQQSPTDSSTSLLSFSDLGLRVLVEVASIYNERDQPEALIAAGSIVFGKDACKSYPGFGVVSSWPTTNNTIYDPEGDRTGWIVGSISQEHGILSWQGSKEHFRALTLGGKLLIWPNHACMSGPNFGFYLVIDSQESDPDKIIDIWTRCRGW